MFEFETYTPTRIVVGKDGLRQIGGLSRTFGKRALLVTGRKSMREAGFTGEVENLLRKEGMSVETFEQAGTNPERSMVNEGGRLVRKGRIDVVIGMGGGSAMDTAKGVAVLGKEGEDIWDFIGGRKISGPIVPLICIPSTAGTGSEVTKYAVFSDGGAGLKEGFASDFIMPLVAVIDPRVMASAPRELTAYAGGDAFAQAVESYLTKLAHPYSELLSLEAIRLCVESLPRAVENGRDLDARVRMGWASTLAGIAINLVDVVIGHHVSEAVGAIYHTHHGMTATLLLPYAMEFNASHTGDKLAAIARVMGEDVDGLSPGDAAKRGIDAVRAFLAGLGIPARLRDIGVKRDDLPAMLDILDGRTEDLEAGNYPEINRNSVGAFVESAL
jgi:alcohol dehydrogenase class IV